MASLIDRVESAMLELGRQPWGDDSSIYHCMTKFEDGIDFLTRFLDSINKWSDAMELAPHLGSLATKIEASTQKIGGEFLEEMNRDKWASVFTMVSFNLGGTLEKRASRWLDVFDKLNYTIDLLKPEIAEACDILSIHSVHSHSPMRDFDQWKKFVKSTYLNLCDVNRYFDAHFRRPQRGQIRFIMAPSFFEVFLDCLPYGYLENPKIEDFMIKVGSATISGALLSCQCWATNYDPKIRKDMIAARLDLKQKIWFTNPEFVAMILKLLKASEDPSALMDVFLKHLITSVWEYPRASIFSTLGRELTSLVTSVLNMPEEDAEDVPVQMFLSDIKQLFMEIASLHHSPYDVNDRSVAGDLLAKIWLIKIEIFLRAQLTADNILPEKMQIDALNHVVAIIKASSEGNTKNVYQILMLMEEVAREVATLKESAPDKKINKEMVRNLLLKLLLKILFFKAELVFLKLHDNNDSLVVSFKARTESLHEGFKIMIPSVINQPGGNLKDGKLEFSHIEAVARRVISLYHLILTQNISEEMLQYMYPLLSDLLDEIKLIMKELKEIYLHVQRSSFPKTNPAGFIDSLLSKLLELLNCKADLVESVIEKQQIAEILGHVEFFQPFLEDISEEDIMFQEVKDLGARVINVSYEAEYLIDSIISGKEAEWHNMIWLYHFLQDIRDIKIQVSKNQVKRTNNVKVHNLAQTNRQIISRATTPKIDEDVVSLIDQEELIVDRLVGGFQQLDIVSIVGMPGIGKTTLAKKVYGSPAVVSQFRIRAWCCVSESYRKREVLLEILNHITALTENMIEMPDEDLDFKLYKILKGQTYLIVFDDIWNTDVLDDLGRKLPNDGAGSRILITSRHHHVALKANPHADPHRLRQLSDPESWNLLQKKIFHEDCCPEELVEIGEKIAESCKGLPLAIVAAAGLLERIGRQHNRWKEIAESLSSRIIDDPQEQCRQILELSYEHLPDNLKACFLYLGAFLEDQDIPARKLMQLWIAEGFVPKTEFKSLEDLAGDFLMDLIGRSLVIFSQRRSRGGAKACRVHDVLRKLCQSKAKEDNFLQVITGSDVSDPPLHDLDYVFSANFGNPSSSVTYEDHRLSFWSKRKHFVESRHSGPHVRSLLYFATNDKDPRCPYDISFISHKFRLLKVLDLECINMGTSFHKGIELLVHLRFLAVAGYIDSVPPSIANLWNLETLIVKGLKGNVNLPGTIWCLKKLLHVHVSDFAVISLQDDQQGNSSRLDYLVAISSLFLRFGEETDNILRQFPNLRKLKCIFSESWDTSQNCDHFPSLEVLNQLESLKISYYGRALHPGEFSFPSNLKKLTLSNFRLPWDKISVIGQLPNLEVLKLLSRAFVGEQWDMVEGEFPELKFLKLDTLDIAEWNACSDHLPKLQELVLRCCKNLKEVPSSIGEIPTLERINVQWCGDRVDESVRQIREEGDERLKVFINFAELDFSST